MANVFTNPEEFGLVKVGSADLNDTEGQYDVAAVWRDNSGNYLWGYDLGFTGVDTPFEDYTIDDLLSGTKEQAIRGLREEAKDAEEFVQDVKALDERVGALVKAVEATGDQWTTAGTF